jgi:hypothetical protein
VILVCSDDIIVFSHCQSTVNLSILLKIIVILRELNTLMSDVALFARLYLKVSLQPKRLLQRIIQHI